MINQEVELEICDLNVDGTAVARREGRVYFVDRGLPGEVLLAEITGEKKRVLLARAVRTLRASPDETAPFCRYFGECGGCSLQNLSYQAQLSLKRQRAVQALARIGGLKRPEPEIIPSPRLTGYRNKMEYAFGRAENGAPLLGLRRRASHTVLDIESCPLQSREAGLVLHAVREWAIRHELAAWHDGSGCLRHAVLREPEYAAPPAASNAAPGRQRSLELICGRDLPGQAALDELWTALAGLGASSLLISQNLAAAGPAVGERKIKSYGPATLWESFGPLLMEFPLGGFAQVNTGAASLLYERAAGFANLQGGEILWDIYCGAGALALRLAGGCREVRGLEANERSVQAARANASRLGFGHCRFTAGEAAAVLGRWAREVERGALGRPDALVTDPPRSGMSAAALRAILLARPGKIIYVSCDPATLARDLAALSAQYTLENLALVDLFPHTLHVEAVASLTQHA